MKSFHLQSTPRQLIIVARNHQTLSVSVFTDLDFWQ